MALTYAQAQQIAAANQPPGGYTQDQINQWASWAVSNPDVAYSPNPAQQVKDSIVAAQVQAGERSAGNLTQADVNQFNNLVASGNFTAAANLASSLGVDPAVTAAYVNANVANLNLPSDFRVNASNVPSLAGQTIGPVNPAVGPEYYPSSNTITAAPTVSDSQIQYFYNQYLNRTPRADEVAFWRDYSTKNSPEQTLAAFQQSSRKEIGDFLRSGYASKGVSFTEADINAWTDRAINEGIVNAQKAWDASTTPKTTTPGTTTPGTTTTGTTTPGTTTTGTTTPGTTLVDYSGEVNNLYSRYLNRTPSASEISFWSNYYKTNTPEQTLAAFKESARKELGDVLSSGYTSVLGRQPRSEEVNYWVNYALDNGVVQAAAAFNVGARDELAAKGGGAPRAATGNLVSELTGNYPYGSGGGIYKRTPQEEFMYQGELARIPITTTIANPVIPTTTTLSPGMARVRASGEMTPEQYYANIREGMTSGKYTKEQQDALLAGAGATAQDVGVAMGTIARPITVTAPTMPGATAGTTQSIGQFIQSKIPPVTPTTEQAGPVFTPAQVTAQLELERLKAANAPPAVGLARGGDAGSESRRMLSKLGGTPVKKFSDGGSADESSSDVDLAEQMTVGTLPRDREPGKAEEAFRALVEGGQGFLGLEPGRRGSEAYRTGQALSNLPALALPAAAIKGTGKAKDALRALGKKEAVKTKAAVPPGAVVGPDGEPVVIYRGVVFAEDPTEGMMTGASRPGYATFGSTSPHVASSYANPELEMGERGAITPLFVIADQVVEFPVTVDRYGSRRFDKFEFDRQAKNLKEGQVLVARNVVDYGPRAKVELDPEKLYSYGSDIYAFGPKTKTEPAIGKVLETKPQSNKVSTTDFIRKRQAGSPPEGEVPTDDYIQQMFTGTPPVDRQRSPGLLPPELRQVVDVPLDLANLFVRGTAAAVAGPVYGLYKGITSDKYGTPEGVQEASSEAARMMAKITGEPKTKAARDVVEFIGEKAEQLKLAPTPQLLTAPLPGPGAASALLRNYELAQTPPVGAINVPGAKAQVTPPKNEMGFFSPTEQVVMNLPQEKGTAQQMLAQISKAPGAKAAELRATGLEEFLKSKGTAPVTRQEIQNYLANNRVQVDEVVLGKGQTLSPEAKRLMGEAEKRMMEADDKMAPFFEQMAASGASVAGQEPYSMFYRIRGPLALELVKGDQDAINELYALKLPPDVRQAALDFAAAKGEYRKYARQARRMDKPKFDKYNIPGGTNPREIYLTLPGSKGDVLSAEEVARLNELAQKRIGSSLDGLSPPEQSEYFSLIGRRERAGAAFTVPSSHSVSPEADKNRLAHIFLDDRTDAEGNKVLFVQELQSDWGQQRKNNLRMAEESGSEMVREGVERSTPSAPFINNTEDWVNLALKRVIKDAVDNGYDKVAFIKGEQAAKKYSLSTVLDGIDVFPEKPNKSNTFRSVDLKVKGGGRIPLAVNEKGIVETAAPRVSREFVGKPLSEIIGKDMAEKVMSAKRKTVEGDISFDVEDLVVGGKGMKGFYDNILPKTANKLLSKLGSKIEPVGVVKGAPSQMPFESSSFLDWMQQNHPGTSRSDAARAWGMGIDNNLFVKEFYEATKADQHLGFKITPEMIDMVKTQGLPQFAAGGEVRTEDFIRKALA